MKIISHRGYWKTFSEKNSLVAFERSFKLGFGTETDVRDYQGVLVISHDIPKGREILLDDFLNLAAHHSGRSNSLTIALNIKADGLSAKIARALASHEELDCFVFDMSVPDMRSYLVEDLDVFTRMSEVETKPVWLERATGVWLDSFDNNWFGVDELKEFMTYGKRICIVSPELHGRPHLPLWLELKRIDRHESLILCTDLPEDAQLFFAKN